MSKRRPRQPSAREEALHLLAYLLASSRQAYRRIVLRRERLGPKPVSGERKAAPKKRSKQRCPRS